MPEGTTRSIDEIIGDVGVMIVGGFQEPAHGAANSLCLIHSICPYYWWVTGCLV